MLNSCSLSHLSQSYETLIQEVSLALSKSLEEAIEKPSLNPYWFYWNLVNGVCSKLDKSPDNGFSWIAKYANVLLLLGKINSTGQSCPNYASMKDKPETKYYIAMIDQLQRALQLLQESYIQQLMTYDDLDLYLAHHKSVRSVAGLYKFTKHVHKLEEVKATMETFRSRHTELSKLLIRSIESSWYVKVHACNLFKALMHTQPSINVLLGMCSISVRFTDCKSREDFAFCVMYFYVWFITSKFL